MNIKNRLQILILLLNINLNILPAQNSDELSTIKLKSHVLALIDGIPGIMDEHIIHKTVYIGQEIHKFQHGVYNKETKKRDPQHKFDQNLCSLKELVVLEDKFKENNDTKSLEELNKTLVKLKEEFQEITGPFIKDAQGSKQQMIELISEFCHHPKINRKKSLLLNWAESTNEQESLKRNVTSIKILDQFCNDLTDFLKVLVRSCPKALKKYQEKHKRSGLNPE